MSGAINLAATRVTGLEKDVTINIDHWGVAHIRAENLHDLFFAQGWNAARDRLWQVDLARKRGLGLLARDFGPGYLEQDKAARLFLYRGDMKPEWQAYGEDSQEICTAFAKGINAYVDGCLSGEIALPPEFELLGTKPDHWAAEDVVRVRSHSLVMNATSELLRAKIMAAAGKELGAKLDLLRKQLVLGNVPQPVEGLDPAVVTDRVLRDFRLAVSPVNFSKERLEATLDEARFWTAVTPAGEIDRAPFEEGSNNWAISADKTSTGRPILSLDPHRTHVLPSIRYVVHLTMPGLDVIGAGEPMVPGISMGHNGTAAFGLTIFGADQEDIYVYDTHENAPDQYAYADGWEEMTTIKETIPVKGYPDQEVEFKFTRHGPVLYQDKDNNRAFALRTVWMDAGMAPYMASLSVMKAKNYPEYFKALEGWGCPSVNHIYADTANTIVWKPSGATPIRDNWDGLLPVLGNGQYEWNGYLAPDAGPVAVNPSCGFVATANALNIPPEWTANNPAIGYEWADSSRQDTLYRELSRTKPISLADCVNLQVSTFSPIAARAIKRLQVFFNEENANEAWQILHDFDGNLAASSGAAALFEVWFSKHLGKLVAQKSGATEQIMAMLMPFDSQNVVAWLENAEVTHELTTELAQSLADAMIECRQLLGNDLNEWNWGKIHNLSLRHPLQSLTDKDWSMATVPVGGSSSTLNLANYRLSDFSVTSGPSVRMVIDVGEWDNSLFVNNPGQSGVPMSDHYGDLLQNWHQAKHVPLVYSQIAVEKVTATQIKLVSK
ncbi:penicillin acylase family protein [Paenochrobactrum sp. BZR 588]|uniref:penicillin acylase family protein n=1 Tax=unclassified Paenochrobactrum TaxID=2639760 RepID=UPI00385288E1